MSKNSKDPNNPYGNHSIEDVMAAENGSYYIQIGTGMFESERGKIAFPANRAESFYFQVLEGLKDMRKNGTQEDKEEALECLLNFRIIPLRFH